MAENGTSVSERQRLAVEPARWWRVLEGLVRSPARGRSHLRRLRSEGLIDEVPTPFQVVMGAMYMRYRILFRSETIGQDTGPLRDTRRARWLAWRLLRAPFLLWEGAVAPGDLTGFSARPGFLVRHVISAYHPGDNASYDLALLKAHPGFLEILRERVAVVVADPHHAARDLVVYEGYHERLLMLVDRALAGDFRMTDPAAIDSDASLRGFVRWCATQPATPRAALRAALRGEVSLRPR
jgi:hypothetical protein